MLGHTPGRPREKTRPSPVIHPGVWTCQTASTRAISSRLRAERRNVAKIGSANEQELLPTHATPIAALAFVQEGPSDDATALLTM